MKTWKWFVFVFSRSFLFLVLDILISFSWLENLCHKFPILLFSLSRSSSNVTSSYNSWLYFHLAFVTLYWWETGENFSEMKKMTCRSWKKNRKLAKFIVASRVQLSNCIKSLQFYPNTEYRIIENSEKKRKLKFNHKTFHCDPENCCWMIVKIFFYHKRKFEKRQYFTSVPYHFGPN